MGWRNPQPRRRPAMQRSPLRDDVAGLVMLVCGMIITPDILTGRATTLVPLSSDHDAELKAACDADQDIWNLYPIRMNGDAYDGWRKGVDDRVASGVAVAYAILHDGRTVGVSLFAIDGPNRRVEIGNTYLHPETRGGVVNPESKMLMIGHAFDCGVNCVAFKVDALNERSRRAVLKLGAHQDGIIRADRITWTGRVRDTVNFSILPGEWPSIRERLDARICKLLAPNRDAF